MLVLKLTAVEGLVAMFFATSFAHGESSGLLTSISVAVAAVAIVVAGAFTIRAHVASTWRNEADAQKDRADRLQQEMVDERQEQQTLRHQLKEQLAVEKAEKLLLAAKTDLSGHESQASQRHEATLGVLLAIQSTLEALAESVKGA
jgi:transposase-like protein